jgi:hypothetical protein
MKLPKLPKRLKDPHRMPYFEVGDMVYDYLTQDVTEVLEIIPGGYILDHLYLEGYRYSWEVSLPFGMWDEEE